MSLAWQSADEPAQVPIGAAGWMRVALRGTALGTVTFGCLGLLLLMRLVERPLFAPRRPVTPYITQFVCRSAFAILGMRRTIMGERVHEGAVVANHASWLDIFALNAAQRVYFVSKSDVRDWPAIGWLARATGTVFIDRDPRAARRQRDLLRQRLGMGHTLLFFPEGTSTDGRRVLPFRSTLFAAFFGDELPPGLGVQPVTLAYRAPRGADPRFYGWWGGMEFGPHLLKVLAAPRQGAVEITYHAPLMAADHANRKQFARRCEDIVRTELTRRLGDPG